MSSDGDDEITLLKQSAIDSVRLAIELYNRPHSVARKTSVLILLGHGFEMLLKSSILENGGSIHTENENNQTIGLKKAIHVCRHGNGTDNSTQILSEDQTTTLRKIKSDRDSAAHYLVEISEELLYVSAEAGVYLFDDLLDNVFDEKLGDHLPGRVLPLSTNPPENMAILIDQEYTQVRELIDEDKRERAKAKLRPIEGLNRALDDDDEGPVTDDDLENALDDVSEERDWTQIFRGVATLDLTTEGAGQSIGLKITKSEGVPVNLMSDEEAEEEGEDVPVAVKRVNERDFYNLGIEQMAEGFDDLTWPKLRTIVDELDIQNDSEYYKEITVGSSDFKRYSGLAVERIREALQEGEVDPEEAWEEHGW